MTRRFEMREIAAPKSAQVSGTQVPYFGGIPQNGDKVDRAVGAVLDTAERVARLHDLGVQQRATQERNRLRDEMDLELQKAAAVQMGSDESLWRKDGSLNQDKYDGIVAKYRERNNAVQPGDFWLGENSARYEGEQKLEHDDIGLRAAKFVGLKTIENTRKVFADNPFPLPPHRHGQAWQKGALPGADEPRQLYRSENRLCGAVSPSLQHRLYGGRHGGQKVAHASVGLHSDTKIRARYAPGARHGACRS